MVVVVVVVAVAEPRGEARGEGGGEDAVVVVGDSESSIVANAGMTFVRRFSVRTEISLESS